MYFELALLAYLIDLWVGELPGKHPVMWMGDYITYFEKKFYANRMMPGAILVFSLLALTGLISVALVYLSRLFPKELELIVLAILASTGIAMHLLHKSVSEVLESEQPKQAISYLVSRDTETMTEQDIYKAALETWAENLSDGVIAPLLYLLLFGLPGIAIYKAINTLDSMVAYKTERYFYFGKVAAWLDDVANYIPARLTALMIVLVAPKKQASLRCLFKDGNKLESPNAGYPIAAMAGALGVALGGDAYYHGQLKHKPTLGVSVYSINSAIVRQSLAMKNKLDSSVIGFLGLGSLLT